MEKKAEGEKYRSPDKFDLVIGSLNGRADVASVKPSTKQVYTPVIGGTQTFIVQTLRTKEEGDHIFIQYLDADGSFRMAIPPAVADLIARQREALTSKNRRAAAREQAQVRKAAGVVPGFLRKKGKRKGGKRGNEGAVPA